MTTWSGLNGLQRSGDQKFTNQTSPELDFFTLSELPSKLTYPPFAGKRNDSFSKVGYVIIPYHPRYGNANERQIVRLTLTPTLLGYSLSKFEDFSQMGGSTTTTNPRLSTMISCPEVSRSLCTEMGARSGAMRCSLHSKNAQLQL